ncbi:acyl-CoA-binding domain-containing protein 4 isoform 2-T2 [Erethizon dorsatum]
MGTERGGPEPACREQFRAAVSVIQSLPRTGSYRPSYEEMLRFYSYYKQATLGPCLAPRPGFWDPIGRYKWDAWHSLGRMSREEAMSAYVAEMKLVAQKVIDTVPLGEVAEDVFGYFAPLYQVIPDMPRPPEAFLRRVTEPQGSRDLDLEVFCDCLEQLEPKPVRPHLPCPTPESVAPPPPHLVTQVLAKQGGVAGGDPESRTSPEPPMEKEELGGGPWGPQDLDIWLVGTVRALQESMQDVQGRLRSLESKPQLPAQVRPALILTEEPPSSSSPCLHVPRALWLLWGTERSELVARTLDREREGDPSWFPSSVPRLEDWPCLLFAGTGVPVPRCLVTPASSPYPS